MLVIGITGSLATGKSTVAKMLADRGARIVDADKIAHHLISPKGSCFKPVVKTFGTEILKKGQIDRKKLASIVFQKPQELRRLEGMLHPAVNREIVKQMKHYKKAGGTKVVVIDVPLLFEAGLDRYADYTMVVKASRRNQIKRAKARGLSASEAKGRINSQWPLHEKIRQADIIIDNNHSLTKTKRQVENLWQKLQQKKRN